MLPGVLIPFRCTAISSAALGLILLFGFMISPAYYIPMSVFSVEFGGSHSATLVCLIDAFGYAASVPFGFIGGRLADSAGGWSSFMILLLVLSILATVSVWLFMHAEYRTLEKKSMRTFKYP